MIKQDISENRVNISYLSIGSNLGNKKRNIEKAKYLLEKNQVKIIKTSSIYETFSWPNRNHPKFYNDILDYKGLNYTLRANNNILLIPHPRLHNRNFVLFPLFEIEKEWKHPLKKTKIQDLIRKLDNSSLYSIKQI